MFSGLLLLAAAGLPAIELPPGFRIEVYAENVEGARSMARGPDGTLYVGTRRTGKVYALRDSDGDHRVDRRYVLAEGLNMPNGVALRDGDLYVAEVSRILRFKDIAGRLDDPPAPEVVADDFPTETHHGWKFIAFGPDGWLYVPIGAPCNVCDEQGYAVITRMRPDGSGRETVARGVRNTVGFDWHPETGELWFTDNGRDWMGQAMAEAGLIPQAEAQAYTDRLPPCELNRLAEPGQHFGFPYCHGADLEDPQFGEGRDCGNYTPPTMALGPHVAPLGMRFYTGEQFPAEYRGQIFIAEHGSWNRTEKIGYRITLVRLEDGKAVGYETFASGWLLPDGSVRGRPVDLLILPDGSLLVSDDHAGRIYRISYGAPAA